ncbi:MAG: hypothetical protein GXN98_03295 [Euryarchaeota archaeon]|nr:hypothetical protein [Euryarchaeota archaeon]
MLAFLRYYPSERGERRRGGVRYASAGSTSESFAYLRERYPEYLFRHPCREMQAVPLERVREHLLPERRLEEIVELPSDGFERDVRALVLRLERVVPLRCLGITGSALAGLHSPTSDIDLVVYGRENLERLRRMLAEGWGELSLEQWRRCYRKRFPSGEGLSFEEFLWHERRKLNRLSFRGRLVDLLLVRRVKRRWRAERCRQLGRRCIRAVVVDDSLSFDVPARYGVEHESVREVVSYTHTYTGQAVRGEVIEACGMLEEAGGRLRLVVGTSREAEGEYIRVLRRSAPPEV